MERRVIKEIEERVRNRALSNISKREEIEDEAVCSLLDELILEEMQGRYSPADKLSMRKKVFNSLRGLDVLEEFLADPEVTEIMVNGPDRIFIEKGGIITKTDARFENAERLEDVIQRIVAGCNREVNSRSPIADARLKGGERANIVLAPVAVNGPVLTIRRFAEEPFTMDRLVSSGCLSREGADYLENAVKKKKSLFISGGTGSGKTTFLNVLTEFIPKEERIITIEDSAELRLSYRENLVSLETRNATLSGCSEISIRDLIKTSLRMRPDRVIVGEVRGAEAYDCIQSFNTGHKGSMCTVHSNSCRDSIIRLENMILMAVDIPIPAIRHMIASGLDLLIHLERTPAGERRVSEICEIVGVNNGEIELRTLFEYRETYSEDDEGCMLVKG